MNIFRRDLNLLLIFHVLYQERNVSSAANRISLSQPALSHKLNKLRREFDDPLFIRTARGLTPTSLAHELAPEVQSLVAELAAFYDQSEGVDFLQRSDHIHLFTTDYVEQMLLPGLLPRVRAAAPNLILITHNTRGELPRDELEKGTCDIAIAGFYASLPDNFRQQRLLSESFVVLASRQNRRVSQGQLTLEEYVESEHLLTTLTGDLHGVVDKVLAEQGLTRRVAAGMSSFLTPSRLLPGSDWLLTCLNSLALDAAVLNPELVIYPAPLALPRVEIMQIWHERTESDRLRCWLRQQIQEVANEVAAKLSSTTIIHK